MGGRGRTSKMGGGDVKIGRAAGIEPIGVDGGGMAG